MTKANQSNPWGLTQRECEMMEAVCRLGRYKLAADDLGIKEKTVMVTMHDISKKMGAQNRVLAILEWDRKMRGQFTSRQRETGVFRQRPVASVWELGAAA